ncbi:macrophage mannose receptor 1 [Elysia marginata]|uniref:Macrophage mannose receptor 1 n=1 Tax=Elysia marginata TaxID=1093978 RepID=A0AAV4EXZ8_9GAST|nr:macrophage mannose receptor 1 [Elysia marginata]
MCKIVLLWLLTLGIAVVNALPTVNDTCPPGLLATTDPHYLQVHDGYCFNFVLDHRKNYAKAQEACMADGGTLALPKTQALNDFVTDQLLNHYNKSKEVWIGLHRNDLGGHLTWEDGTDVVWRNFGTGDGPLHGWLDEDIYDCVALDPKNGGSWHDYQCDEDLFSRIVSVDLKKAFICQYQPEDDEDSSGKLDLKEKTQDPTQGPSVPRTIDNTCPSELLNTTDRFFLQIHNDSCFHFVLGRKKNYQNANKDCLKDGGTLALPQTQFLNNYLVDQLLNHYNKSNEVWIGLHRGEQYKGFFWEDNSELEWSNFPDGKGPGNSWFDVNMFDCIALNPKTGGSWHDYLCEGGLLSWILNSDLRKAYICQYKYGHYQNKHASLRTVANTCPPALVTIANSHYLQVREESCFHFVFNKPEIYSNANKMCEKHGGTLAMPKTQALNDYLADQLYHHYHQYRKAWIGLHDLKREGTFVWEDGTELDWSNFAKGQGPRNTWLARGFEDCIALDPNDQGRWHDFQCDHNLLSWLSKPDPRKIYICQYTPGVKGKK